MKDRADEEVEELELCSASDSSKQACWSMMKESGLLKRSDCCFLTFILLELLPGRAFWFGRFSDDLSLPKV